MKPAAVHAPSRLIAHFSVRRLLVLTLGALAACPGRAIEWLQVLPLENGDCAITQPATGPISFLHFGDHSYAPVRITAADGREILSRIDSNNPPHLLILDLEIPYLDELEIWTRLNDRQPPLPVVIHTFLPEYPTHLTVPMAAAFLEKKGDTDELKAVVAEVINKHYPKEFGRLSKRAETGQP